MGRKKMKIESNNDNFKHIYAVVVVSFGPPRDHDTCSSSSWTIAWHVTISRISNFTISN